MKAPSGRPVIALDNDHPLSTANCDLSAIALATAEAARTSRRSAGGKRASYLRPEFLLIRYGAFEKTVRHLAARNFKNALSKLRGQNIYLFNFRRLSQ